MTTTLEKHCPTCQCYGADPKVVGFCDAEITRGHETFECLEAKGHRTDHEGPGYHGPPCSQCGALDEHAEGCTTMEMEDTSLPFIVIRWNDAGQLLTWPETELPNG